MFTKIKWQDVVKVVITALLTYLAASTGVPFPNPLLK